MFESLRFYNKLKVICIVSDYFYLSPETGYSHSYLITYYLTNRKLRPRIKDFIRYIYSCQKGSLQQESKEYLTFNQFKKIITKTFSPFTFLKYQMFS